MRTLFFLSCLTLGWNAQAIAQERHVVVISIDGLPSYLLDDPKASLPVLRGMISRGSVAEQGLGVSNPSVTWPNHTTLMSGVHPETHGVIFNGQAERHGKGKPITISNDRAQRDLVRVPLLFDVLKEASKTSASINWPCTRGSTSIDVNMPNANDEMIHTTPALKDELTEAGLLKNFATGGGPVRDAVWIEAACRTIRDKKPNLLALHVGNLDGVHHRYGPRTPAGYSAAALADALVGRVLAAIEEAGIGATTTVFVVSDHGFIGVSKSIRPNVILRKAGLLEADGGKVTTAKAHVIPEGGIGMVYLTDPEASSADRDGVRRLFEGVEGVAAVLGPEDYPRYRFPTPETHAGMADLVIACKPGYSIGGSAAGEETIVEKTDASLGAHGYLSTEPEMRAVFIAAGAGIKRGVRLETVDNADVAPTVARLLSVEMANVSGRVIEEILDSPR